MLIFPVYPPRRQRYPRRLRGPNLTFTFQAPGYNYLFRFMRRRAGLTNTANDNPNEAGIAPGGFHEVSLFPHRRTVRWRTLRSRLFDRYCCLPSGGKVFAATASALQTMTRA